MVTESQNGGMYLNRLKRHIYNTIPVQAAVILVLVIMGTAMGRSVNSMAVTLQKGQALYPLEAHYSLFVDRSGSQTVNDVSGQVMDNRFIPSSGRALNLGVTKSTAWVRFTLRNNDDVKRIMVLKLGTSTIDHAVLHSPLKGGTFSARQGGQLQDSRGRDYYYRLPCFTIDIAPHQEKTLYLEMKTSAILETSLTLESRESFVKGLPEEYMLLGFFYAAFLVAIAYNLFLYVSLRDLSRLLYVLYASVFCIMWFYLDGLWHQFGFPTGVVDILTGTRMANAGTLMFMVLFACSFFDCRRRTPKLNKVLMTIAGVSAVNVVMVNFLPLAQYKAPLRLAWLVSIPTVMFTGVYFWRRGLLRARYFVVAWIMVLVGAALFMGHMYLNLFPESFAVRYSWRIASVMEIILLSLALADRINELAREKELAQTRALEAEHKLTLGLESQVAERTRELLEANSKLERMSNVDDLTGLFNRRYFDYSLKKEWSLMKRTGNHLCLVMVDVDYFKEYNDSNGHQAGDRCLQSVGESLSSCAGRASDICARYGGEEFALILPATDESGGRMIAEAVRMHIANKEIPHSGERGVVTASFGVASVVPGDDTSPEMLLKQADAALYQSKSDGRNRVTVG